jgi:hypothetical protein
MKVKSFFIVMLLSSIFAGAVFSQSNTVVTIGGSYWRGVMKFKTYDEWTYQTTEVSKAGNLFGPYINLRFNKLSLGGSWFFGSWDFSSGNGSAKIKRSDLNLSLGYSIADYITLFGAYKILKLSTEVGSESSDFWNLPYIGGGASLTYPIPNSSVFLFGSAAYLTHATDKMTVAGVEEKVDDNITSYTIGLGYRLESGLSLVAGFRGDVHSTSESSDDNNLKINGLIVTLAYSLR